MHILFTGYYNGFGVEIRSLEETELLYHMGCFGKGSASRSRPKANSFSIMRKRQFQKRQFWYKKFGSSKNKLPPDDFLKVVDAVTAKIISDSEKEKNKDVIDLVSSDEEVHELNSDDLNKYSIDCQDDSEIVVIVPNSDSEGENYFENFKPKCCLNKVKVQEKLMLSLEEAFFLVCGLGYLQVLYKENKPLALQECWQLFCESDVHFIPKYVVYHYFRSKGYIVKPGLKFGGDYLLYKEGPGITHADFIVVIKNIAQNTMNSWTSTLGHIRMASTTIKEILMVEVIKQENFEEASEMPEGLCRFSVTEILLSKNIPVSINTDDDYYCFYYTTLLLYYIIIIQVNCYFMLSSWLF